MRIWAFPSFYPIDLPGRKWLGIFSHRQYKGLVENGAELSVIVPVLWRPRAPFHKLHFNWKQLSEFDYPDERTYDGIKVYHPKVSNMKPSKIFNKPYDERYIDCLAQFFKDKGITLDPKTDIFYSQWLSSSAIVQKAAHRLGIKSAILGIGDDVVVWPHNNANTLKAFQKVWSEADMRFAVAGYLAKEANKLTHKDLPYTVIRRGVEYTVFKPVTPAEKLERRKEFKLPEDKTVILIIGSPIRRKGWLDLFDALAKLKGTHKDIVLVGVHAGDADIDLDTEARQRDVDDIFMNMGEIDTETIYKLYNAADIFCLPSHWEGLANAVVEAMSSGLPVITTSVCGHPELITDYDNGMLIPLKSPDILAERLNELLNDEQLRKTLGGNARNFIVNKWGNFADNAKVLYEHLKG